MKGLENMSNTVNVQADIRNAKVNTFVVAVGKQQHVVLVYNRSIFDGCAASLNCAVVVDAHVRTRKQAEACYMMFCEKYEYELFVKYEGFFIVGAHVILEMPTGRQIHKLVKS